MASAKTEASLADLVAFVNSAHPHSWMLVADDLHEQAKRIRSWHGRGQLQRWQANGGSKTWDVTNRTAFLLGGFALENAIKAFLVYEHPDWIGDGKLGGKLKSHSLTKLAATSSLVPYKARGMRILRVFEVGLRSWARYPCGVDATDVADPDVLGERDWRAYLWLTSAYGRKMKRLLVGGWKGPHGVDGYFSFEGVELLAADSPTPW